uniref:Putative beta-barrel assembly-enhancing protease n=1 Tax=Candidatus Kentrum sp. TC TaxID=2126339 RepID=A0A450YVY4_9GAMM|nr:MAG: Putative Zn-dependent protease, contains TPR repeats [Candidatus Kentron sp. TC]
MTGSKHRGGRIQPALRIGHLQTNLLSVSLIHRGLYDSNLGIGKIRRSYHAGPHILINIVNNMVIPHNKGAIVPGIPLSNQAEPVTIRASDRQSRRSRSPLRPRNSARWNWSAFLRRISLLAFVFTMPGFAREMGAGIMLPDIGDSSETYLSAANARRLGEAFMREARARISIIDEPEISSYLNGLGYRLASHGGASSAGFGNTGAAKTDFTFFAVRDPAINAFAVPGGFIGINAGLILNTESESELAAVLGHEIAHIRQRHIARAIQLSDNMNPLAIAGVLAAILIGSQSSQAGRAAMTAVTAGTMQKRIDFTRANEKEADRIGMGILSAAGFDPRAAPDFFERLQTAHRYYSQPPEFLSIHPVTVSRIADSRNRAEQYPYRQYVDSLAYHLTRAHLAVMMEQNPKKSITYFDNALRNGKYRNRAATRYGLALASMAANRWKEAKAEIGKLLKTHPNHVVFRARLAEIELASGHISKSTDIYADALLLHPGHQLLTEGYARALLQGNKPKKVIALLDRQGGESSRSPTLQQLLAKAFAHTSNRTGASAALAEHHYLNGDIDAAIRQLRIALETSAQDYYRNSRIEARLKQFEEERNLRAKQ